MSKDPYKYFRVEAREIVEGLTQGVLELEKGGASREVVGRLLRHAHTLKGAARIVRVARIAELSHEIEDRLEPYREGTRPLAPGLASELLRAIDAIGAELKKLGPTPEATPVRADAHATLAESQARNPATERRAETIHLEIGDTDAVLEGIAEVSVKVGGFEKHVRTAEQAARASAWLSDLIDRAPGNGGLGPLASHAAGARWRELRASVDRLAHELGVSVESTQRELDQVREKADRLRLVPASETFGVLERAVRDAAQSVGRRVAFETTGGDVRLDAHVLSAVAEALLHLVRNAVAHGIEPESQRVAAGKPPEGRVSLSVERRAGRVTFACRDDGRGIDAVAVRRVAVERGLVSPRDAPALTPEATIALLRRGGLSTARTLSQVAGRGVGFNVVHEAVARLKGELDVQSDGRGTVVALRVPVSLSSIPALVVETSGTTVSLPLDVVVKVLRVPDAELARSGARTSILDGGALVPFLPLSALVYEGARPAAPPKAWSVVIVRSGSDLAAIGVDRVRGTAAEVVRSLPASVGPISSVAGASLDTDGNPRLMLEPAHLVAAAAAGAGTEVVAREEKRAPVLVIDDSLTTRMLEQSILESAGYEVELATSAEEGLEKARARKYGVFVVDVEMPGMDGYEFVALTRRDPDLRRTPAILVTSRGSVEDRRRGADAGAHAYIVKGEFDQGRLLSAIAEISVSP